MKLVYDLETVLKYHENLRVLIKQQILQYFYFSRVPNKSNYIILDIGAGGGISFSVRNALGLKTPIWAVEPSESMFTRLVVNNTRLKYDHVSKEDASKLPIDIYFRADLIVSISVGGAVLKIAGATEGEKKWLNILHNIFSIVALSPDKKAFIQVYNKKSANLIFKYSKFFDLELKSIYDKNISKVDDSKVKYKLKDVHETLKKIGEYFDPELLYRLFKDDQHFSNGKIFLGYCFWIRQPRRYGRIKAPERFSLVKTYLEFLDAPNFSLLKSAIDKINSFLERNKKGNINRDDYIDLFNYLLKTKIYKNLSLFDLWFYYPILSSDELNKRLTMKDLFFEFFKLFKDKKPLSFSNNKAKLQYTYKAKTICFNYLPRLRDFYKEIYLLKNLS